MKMAPDQLYREIIGRERSFAILIDPDKVEKQEIILLLKDIPSFTTHLFVGGSTVKSGKCERVVKELKKHSSLPIILFPGDYSQVTPEADGILFLSLVSGENPEYLIGQQIKSAKAIIASKLEVISTAYVLIDGGKETAVQRVSETLPIPQLEVERIVSICLASQLAGKKIIYLEAGSGALISVHPNIIQAVKKEVNLPIIVGGGLRTEKEIEACYQAGANLVVVGTAFEEEFKQKSHENISRVNTYSNSR
ncbi:geranylgeranylglyceryl/heptaprenylglyceryl phosphate synthase [Mesonia ostreae]|uniref:Geranylgeranylglyceryl phosphate synthase n=1 Tax=Mesonia ostreae TaxID=861110 RepID=A0ABU2KKQ3_9FLAO|nr:geranylgeranylglyceryl/heptaprenylglyceryl phosphate synthase [Mesonia ostreae]MDT0295257.1 geranylgeranylglyceryl/heptaprenylglyceryl phosphate synthase [Mesonia ostreae]